MSGCAVTSKLPPSHRWVSSLSPSAQPFLESDLRAADHGGPQSEWMSIAISTASCVPTSSPQSVGGPRAGETGVHRGVPDHIRSDNGQV